MRTLTGIFRSPTTAETAMSQLRSAGLSDDQLLLLTPRSVSGLHVGRLPVPHPHGASGVTAGHVIGAISGFAGGTLTGAIAMWLMSGGGPIITITTLAIASLTGAVIGAVVGDALQTTYAPPLSYEDLFVYEDALRHGGNVLIVAPSNDTKVETVQHVFEELGAEGIEGAREQWWHRLRENEAAARGIPHDGFTATEVEYLRGFEAALDPRMQGLSYAEAMTFLHEQERAVYEEEPFRRGYERGQAYRRELLSQGQRDSTTPMTPVVH
jgi:hypothetical protein